MKKTLTVQCRDPYKIYYSKDLKLDWDWDAYGKLVLISDSNIAPLYAESLKTHIPKPMAICVMPSGEAFKTRETKQALEDELLDMGCGRDTLLIALGGGVVLDMVGFLAATYCRGVDVIYLPTSLLAMVDASIGGKTGVNTEHAKNMVGIISQPSAVFINIAFLQTLPKREFQAGLVEVLKHAFIWDKSFLDWLNLHQTKILAKDKKCLIDMIYHNCVIKQQVVSQDEFEVGVRQILNFGHTVGHAIEKASNYSVLHGEAVAMGMLVEAHIAWKMGILTEHDLQQMLEVLKRFSCFYIPKMTFNLSILQTYMTKDKKNKKGLIKMALPCGVGKSLPQSQAVSATQIEQAFNWYISLC